MKKVFEELHFVLSGIENEEHVRNLILIIGTDNETDSVTTSVHRFAVSIFIMELLFENITWEEITVAYKEKSRVNIQRQVENY